MEKLASLQMILLVDDDKFTNLIHTKVIERTGLAVTVSARTSVADALTCLVAEPPMCRPCLILLDINMPGLTGWDFMVRYGQLAEPYRRDIIVVMLTTSQNPDDQHRAQQDNNIAALLHKPLRTEQLLGIVHRHFRA